MRIVTGKVVSDKMTNTAVVEVIRFVTHPLYNKRMRRTKKYHADNQVGAKAGEVVEISETRPISKTKFWKINKIIK